MEITPTKRKIVELVERAHEGSVCLPNFQRDFVWARDEVADLIRSMLRRYYIGSLLLLRSDPQRPPFAPQALRGAQPKLTTLAPDILVLDGQQRLTSLLYALTAPDRSLKDSTQRRWYFLNLRLLLEDPNDDEIIFDRTARDLDGLDKLEVQFERRIMPCTELINPSRWNAWIRQLRKWLRANRPDEIDQFENEQEDIVTRMLTGFSHFEVPVIELPIVSDTDDEAIGRICAIFEKLNSTGVPLSIYDLLTARLYSHGIKLHDLWDEACRNNPRLKDWSSGDADTNKFGVLLLRVMALLRGQEVRPKALINLKPDKFAEDWRRAAKAMERALQLVTNIGADGFGVFERKWLPSSGLLPVLAALRAEIEDRKLGDEQRADLRRWYWCNVFLERYSSAVESKSRKDYVEMMAYWQKRGPAPSVFSEAQARIGAPGYRIRDSASSYSGIYSGVFCLLALNQARDWSRGEAIELQKLQDHHIFPRAYLRRKGVIQQTSVNSIANRTLISDETNLKILDNAPAAYLDRIDIFPSGPSEELLNPHFLTGAAVDAMEKAGEDLSKAQVSEVYEEFRSAREAAIITEIRRVCDVIPGLITQIDTPKPLTGDETAEQCIWSMLTRIPIPNGQQQIYKILYDAGDIGLLTEEIVAQLGRDPQEIPGILGALGSRINRTPGYGAEQRPGVTLVLAITRSPSGQWHYRMLPGLREALDRLSPPWLKA